MKMPQYLQSIKHISMRELRSKKTNSDTAKPRARPARPAPKPAKNQKLEHLSRSLMRARLRQRFQKQRMAGVQRVQKISPRLMAACLECEELACMICLELLLQPTTLRCGHSFCLHCIQNQSMSETNLRCGLCRTPDESFFHEPDPHVQKMMAVRIRQAGSEAKREYRLREEDPLHFRSRVGRRLEVGEDVRVRRVRVGEYWKAGKVAAVLETGGRCFYEVEISGSGDRHLLPATTVNLSHNELAPHRSTLPFYLPTSTAMDGLMTVARPYNIDELLWEVNYYAPAATNWWNYEADPIQELDSESVLYLGRNPPQRQEVIEID